MTVTEVELEGIEHVRIATVLRLTLEDAAAVPPRCGTGARAGALARSAGRSRSTGALIPAEALVRADRCAPSCAARCRRVRAGGRARLADGPAPAPAIEDTTVHLPSGPVPADYANVRMGGIGNLTGAPALSAPCRPHTRRACPPACT